MVILCESPNPLSRGGSIRKITYKTNLPGTIDFMEPGQLRGIKLADLTFVMEEYINGQAIISYGFWIGAKFIP